MSHSQRVKNEGEQPQPVQSPAKPGEANRIPFDQRITCTIDEACEVTGLGRTKLYELIGAQHLVTATIGRRRLVSVSSLLALLETNMSK